MGIRDMVGVLWKSASKGPMYIALAFFEVYLGYKLALTSADTLMGFAAVLTAVNGAVFLGGAWKNHSDKKFNGSSVASG